MGIRAVAKFIRVQPRKVRLVAREVVGKPARHSCEVLRFHPSKGATILRKVILSAVANAVENGKLDGDSLKIAKIQIDEGPKTKRIIAKAMGRSGRIFKRTSHIMVEVEEFSEAATVKPHGTQAKPRPSLAKPAKGRKATTAKPEPEQETPTETPVEAASPEAPADENSVEASDSEQA